MRITKARRRSYRELADRYARATGKTEYGLSDVVAWALGRGELETSPDDISAYHIGRMSEALCSDTATDGSGRTVRLRHCVQTADVTAGPKSQQQFLWAHVDEASDEFLRVSLVQRRDRVAGDVAALRADLDFINRRRAVRGLAPIQMDLDYFGGG